MDYTLIKIKRLILKGKYEFRLSAAIQLTNDGLKKEDALEAILNADYLVKKNSTSQDKLERKEKVYIIESFTYDGILMYTKGVIRKTGTQETFILSFQQSDQHLENKLMTGDFCRMCGSKKLRREERDIFLEKQNKKIKDILVWICENCGEEFLDDSSWEQLYQTSRVARRRRALAA